MSKYTTELRYICESYAGLNESKGYTDIDSIVTTASPLIFSSFPIFDESYRLPLEKKILKHYYTREISEETVGLWKLRLETKMNEIMPYYNQLYNSEISTRGFSPLADVNLTTTHDVSKSGSSNTESENELTSETTSDIDDVNRNLYSETPQGALTNLENETYLTNATKNTNNRDISSSSQGTNNLTANESFSNTEEYVTVITGRNGIKSYSKEIMEFRKTFLNIDMMIINDLSDLFFGLW